MGRCEYDERGEIVNHYDVIGEKFHFYTDDRTTNRRWVSVKGKMPVMPGTETPVEWRKIENRYTWQGIQKIPGDIGIILDKTGLTCMDFDKCLDEMRSIIPEKQYVSEILEHLDTFTEISSSGRGLHAWIVTDANTKNEKPGQYEMITDGHVKVTGNPYPNYADKPIRMVDGEHLREILKQTTSRGRPGTKTNTGAITAGKRNETLFKIAASLRGNGLSETEILVSLQTENKERCNPPLPDEEIATIAKSAGGYPAGNHGIDYHNIALQLIDQGFLVSYNGDIFRYNDGKYTDEHGWLNKEIQEILIKREIKPTEKITGHTHEIRHHIINEDPIMDYPFNQEIDFIPVRNGVIKIDSLNRKISLEEHNPRYRFTYQIPVIFNPKASCKPVIEIFRQWVSREDVILLLQYPAQCILQMQGKTYKKAYIFEGERDAGKTTYYQLIRRFFGKENISDVGLRDLCEGRFSLAPLENKITNFHDELADVNLKHVDKFKKLTGDNWHQIERKNKEHYNAFLPAVHAFSCNVPPKVPNIADDAFWRRFEYIIFPNRFGIDPDFVTNTFTDEFLSGFLNFLCKIILRIKRSGKLLRDSDPESIQDLWIKASDSIAAFTKEHTDKDPGSQIPKDEFYLAYSDYCRTNGYKPQVKGRVTSLLSQMGTHATRPGARGSRHMAYGGIKWRDGSKYRLSSWNGDSQQKDLLCHTGQGIS